MRAILVFVLGAGLLIGNLGLFVYRAHMYPKVFVEGRFSTGGIEAVRQEILQAPRDEESIKKTANYVFRRVSADARNLSGYWSVLSANEVVDMLLGAFMIYIAVRLKQNADALRRCREESSGSLPADDQK